MTACRIFLHKNFLNRIHLERKNHPFLVTSDDLFLSTRNFPHACERFELKLVSSFEL